MSGDAQRDLLREALLKIRALKGEVQALERARTEPIAIVGIGCRFPGGASTPDEYWRLLCDGVDAIGDVPDGRWDVAGYYDADPDAPGKSYLRGGGFLGDIAGFDADFFGIAPREALRLDPQQRLLLEVSWEALEHAGLAPDRLDGRTTGVYVGVMGADYAFRQARHLQPEAIDPYMLSGNDLSFAAGRLAYVLGLHGPAMVVSTACSSSLVSVHLAAQALRNGECDLALAGGVNLVLDPTTNVMLAKLRALAKDGRCKTFDADADGYGRGEGCGIVVLERLSEAIARRHRVLAVIRGSAVNHDGASAGLTVPNGRAQEALLRRACEAAGVDPEQVGYVEAHGTGTPLGDPIEVNALARAMGTGRTVPLLVGSVKTNIGHLEAAAGIAGLIKIVLALRHRELPAHLHFRTPNPHVQWDAVPVRVVTERGEWAPIEGRRVAGVSSFGLSGVNAHVILEEADGVEPDDTLPPGTPDAHVLPLSARTEAALVEQARRYARYLAEEHGTSWADICATAATGRAHFAHRAAVVAGSAGDVSGRLHDIAARHVKSAPRVAFLFPSEASVFEGMGRGLFQTQPAFRQVVDECDEILKARGVALGRGRALRDLFASPGASTPFGPDAAMAVFALEVALAAMWRSWGIQPSAIAGVGIGEIAADVVAGTSALEEGLMMAAARAGAAAAAPARADRTPRVPMVSGATVEEMLRRLLDTGVTALLEVGPGRGLVDRVAALVDARPEPARLPGLSSAGEYRGALETLADLYTLGATVDWDAVIRGGAPASRIVTLPTYAFQRERFWVLDDGPSRHARPVADRQDAARAADDAPRESAVALRERLLGAADAARAGIALEALTGHVKQVLGLRPGAVVDPARSLIDLGLDSLMSLELHDRVQAQLGVELGLAQLLSDTTLEQIATLLAERAMSSVQGVAEGAGAGTSVSRHDPDRLMPLSYGQQALWFIHQSHPASAAYNVGVALRVHGGVDVDALRRAWQRLVDRHPALRTVFALVGGVPRRRVLPRQDVCLAVTDASAWTEETLADAVRDRYRRPFDLAHGPLLRVDLFTQDASRHVLLIAMHHIVCDAESCWTLLEELQTVYAAELQGTRTELASTAATYDDFVAWQHTMVAGDEGERHWQFWRRRLAGELPLLDLPLDAPRPPVQTFNGASHAVCLPASLGAALKDLSRAEHTTLYVTLLSAFHVLLHRYTGQEDILIGSATAGRPRQLSRVVGYFVNPVAIRADLSGSPDFLAVLRQVREATIEAIGHQAFPFPLLVERLQPRRDPGRSPIFQADFSLAHTASTYRRRLAGAGQAALDVERFELAEEEGQFDLGVHVIDDDERLNVRLKYNADLFDAATIERMAGSFVTLLEGIVADPRVPVGALPLLGASGRQEALDLGVGPSVKWPHVFVQEMFERQAASTPDAVAVEAVDSGGSIDAASRLTYRELNARANGLAHDLLRRGVGPDTLVGVCLDPSPDLVIALLAVLKAGGAYVPLDPAYPAERLAFMVRDAGVTTVLTSRGLTDRLPAEHAASAIWMEDVRAADADNPVRRVTPDHLAYVIYTSGSTGQPKGAMITHRGLGNYLSWALDAYRAREGDGAPVSSSIAFDATVTSFFAPLLSGGTVVLLPDDGMVEALADVLRGPRRFSLVKITPAHLEILAHVLGSDRRPPPVVCASAFVIGGEALRGDMLDLWHRVAPSTRLINEYGPTETVVGCCVYEAREPISGPVPIGRPIANTQLYVLDARREPVPPGVIGELYIGGDGVARGYLNRPDLTEARFVPDPFSGGDARLYRTGDLARWRADGLLEFVGRIDAQVKIRGFRIEPGEIEAALTCHDEVADSIVIARESAVSGTQLVAYVVASGRVPDAQDLRRHLAARLPDHMIPAAFVVLDGWPLTPNGKIDRAALPAPAAVSAPRALVAPRDTLEMTLAALWADVLGVEAVGLHDDFFDLGGHSLLAVKLIARLERALDVSVPLSAILRGPTVAQMAQVLRRDGAAGTAGSTLVPIQTGAATVADRARAPFFCVPGAGGNPVYLHGLARQLGADQPFYGLQGKGFDGKEAPHATVEEMASHYLEAIRAVQPSGPYHLGGHSLGGWVAFEMAQQLRRQGEDVGIVAVIDTPAPAPADHRDRMQWDEARWIAELADRIGKLLAPDLAVSEDALRHCAPGEPLELFRRALVGVGAYPAEGGLDHLRHTLEVFKAHSRVSYVPASDVTLPRLLLLRTDNEPHAGYAAGDPTWGWGALAPTEVHVLDGDHLAILRPPHVEALAERLAACLATCAEVPA